MKESKIAEATIY